MWGFKSKYGKLTQEEVAEAICKLQTESKSIEDGLVEEQIDDLMGRGQLELNREIKLFYVKKLTY